MSYNERMRVAARFRMQRRFTQRPALRALDTQHAEVDRRRIPLEGLRRTAAWWREQERIDFEYAQREKQLERSMAYFEQCARERESTTTGFMGVYIVTIERIGYTTSTSLTGDTRRSAYGN